MLARASALATCKPGRVSLLLGALLGICCSATEQPASRGASREQAQPTALVAEAPAPAQAPQRALRDQDIDWGANAVMRVLGGIQRNVRHTEYSHGRRVDVARGVYVFDCSTLAQWVLERATPVAARGSAASLGWRPLAADYQRRIASVKPGTERAGWRRIQRVADAMPGDVVAWIKPKLIDSPNTGHVAFVALPPLPVSGYSDAYLVRVIDATSLLHADDTRADGSGFGLGTILLVSDLETGAPRAYGWVGLEWRAFETAIAIGRPMR